MFYGGSCARATATRGALARCSLRLGTFASLQGPSLCGRVSDMLLWSSSVGQGACHRGGTHGLERVPNEKIYTLFM